MEKLLVEVARGSYELYFGQEIWTSIKEYSAGFSQVLVVTDSTVDSLYGERLVYPTYILPQGEEGKNPATALKLLEFLAEQNFDRHSLLIALGGGVVGDLVGFVASIYLRGIAYVQIPTTLVAQVDSSVGGKTGVNLLQGKNLIGSFYQPRRVFIDAQVLQTLPKRALSCGLGEVIKYGIIRDPSFFDFVIANLEEFYSYNHGKLQEVVYRCCQTKAEIVTEDEFDQGLRKILNYGHTIGHALESVTNFQVYSHGEAVLLGMLLEARLARAIGVLPDEEYGRLAMGVKKALVYAELELPREKAFKPEVLIQALLRDKKNQRGKISLILPSKVGFVKEYLLHPDELKPYLERVLY